MDEKNCFNCFYFNQYYVKEGGEYKKLMAGYCFNLKHNDDPNRDNCQNCEPCEYWGLKKQLNKKAENSVSALLKNVKNQLNYIEIILKNYI